PDLRRPGRGAVLLRTSVPHGRPAPAPQDRRPRAVPNGRGSGALGSAWARGLDLPGGGRLPGRLAHLADRGRRAGGELVPRGWGSRPGSLPVPLRPAARRRRLHAAGEAEPESGSGRNRDTARRLRLPVVVLPLFTAFWQHVP